jgi:hypothetical protein
MVKLCDTIQLKSFKKGYTEYSKMWLDFTSYNLAENGARPGASLVREMVTWIPSAGPIPAVVQTPTHLASVPKNSFSESMGWADLATQSHTVTNYHQLNK